MPAHAIRPINPWKSLGTVAIACISCSCISAAAVPLQPGEGIDVLDHNEAPLIPGTNVATDPSLAGDVVARRVDPYSIVVRSVNPLGDVTERTRSGRVEDWVVRRYDTGTLDFYYRILPDDTFAGWITRPWRAESGTPVEVGFRDDLLPAGNPPTRLAIDSDGRSVRAQYLLSDSGYENAVSDSSAPVLFRSSFSQFGTGAGSLYQTVEVEYYSSGGTTMHSFFMPVPEPSTGMMAIAGLFAVFGVWSWKKRSAA